MKPGDETKQDFYLDVNQREGFGFLKDPAFQYPFRKQEFGSKPVCLGFDHIVIRPILPTQMHAGIGEKEIQFMGHRKNLFINIISGIEPDKHKALPRLLITNHSPYLVHCLKLERIYIGVPDGTGAATFVNIAKSRTKSLINTTHSLGISVGEYLFDLMSGDSKSSYILKKYMKI